MRTIYKHKILTILLAGIVCFSAPGITSRATENIEDTAGEEETVIPIESNGISGWPAGPDVAAESAVLMDASTGTILYSKNIDARQYPASITKIMTVLLALENCSMDEIVTFSQNAVFSIERASSHIARTTDEQLTMEQCLYAIMLESANECSNAVAEHISGSIEAFAQRMTERAAELGCTNTNFMNPHGLHNENHYTSARDMALITQAALKLPKFREIAGAVRYTIPVTNKNDEELLMNNHHSMISKNRTSEYFDETVFAGKTGYTTDSLNTLVTCANRNDTDLICVLMRGPSGTPYEDTAALLDYGTNNFAKTPLPQTAAELPEPVRNEIAAQAEGFDETKAFLAPGTPGYVNLPNGIPMESLAPSVSVTEPQNSQATAAVTYSYEGVPLGSVSFQLDLTSVLPAAAPAVEPAETQDGAEDGTSGSGEKAPSALLSAAKYIGIGLAAVIAVLLLVLIFFTIRAHQANMRRRRRRRVRSRRSSSRSHSRSRSQRRERRSYSLEDLHQMDEEFLELENFANSLSGSDPRNSVSYTAYGGFDSEYSDDFTELDEFNF